MNKNFFDKFKIKDKKMLLEFLVLYSRFEFSLKQAGYLQATKNAKSDWTGFISKIKAEFDENKSKKLRNAVKYLLDHPAKKQVVTDEKLDFVVCDSTKSNHPEINRIYNCIRITRNNLFHGGKYPSGSVDIVERDTKLLTSSIIVLEEFLKLNSTVKNIFWKTE
jgi:hypothetical protein